MLLIHFLLFGTFALSHMFKDIPSELFASYIAPASQMVELRRFASTNLHVYNELKHEICERTTAALLQMADFVTYEINSTASITIDHTFSNGAYFSFIYQDKTDTKNYLKLFIIDSSMEFSFLLKSVTRYCATDEELNFLDNQYKISLKSNSMKTSINKNCDKTTESELNRNFFNITNNSPKYRRMLIQWKVINNFMDDEMKTLWEDMLIVLKKDILKILMNEQNNNYGVELYHNDHWLLFINKMINVFFRRSTPGDISVFAKKIEIEKFQNIVTELLDETKTIYHYQLHKPVLNKDIIDQIGSEVFIFFKDFISPSFDAEEKYFNNPEILTRELFWKGMVFCHYQSRVMSDFKFMQHVHVSQAKKKANKLQLLRYKLNVMMFHSD